MWRMAWALALWAGLAAAAFASDHPEYEVAGEPRAFHYNGPYIANRNKWSEVQLPVRKKS